MPLLVFPALACLPAGHAWAAAIPLPPRESVTLVADQWCPYNCVPGAARPGYIIEIAQKAFARNNIAMSYKTIPWTRALEETRSGKYTGIVGASRRDARDFVFPSMPQGRMINKFFVRKGSRWRFNGIPSLSGRSLGAIADYSYDGGVLDIYIAQNSANPSLIHLPSTDGALAENMKLLLDGKLDVVIEDARVMGYFAMTHQLVDRLDEAGTLPQNPNSDLYIAFSPAHPSSAKYADIIARETANMRKTGELRSILAKYGVGDWE